MDNNDEQEAGFDVINAINDDNGGDLFERIYLGQTFDNIPDIPFRLIIDASVTEINYDACYNLRMLREIVFHNKVTRIGRNAFRGCRNLQRIELPAAGLLRLESFAFDGCTSLQQIVIPASVQYMGDEVFEGCTSLERVVFVPTSNVVQLGSRMFQRCINLRFVTLPHNVRSIPAGLFYGCISLTHLQIPASAEEIGEEALYGSGIQSIDCPDKAHRIDREAFKNCVFLERITFHSPDLNLANDIFVNCPLLAVIMIAPWLWSKLFASMKEHPEFIFTFLRHYQTQILDVETPDVRPF